MGKILFIIIITFLLIILAFGLYALIAGWNTMQGKKGREEDLEYWRLKLYGKKVWFNHPFDRSKGLFGRPKR